MDHIRPESFGSINNKKRDCSLNGSGHGAIVTMSELDALQNGHFDHHSSQFYED
jgi:hypothetical protein